MHRTDITQIVPVLEKLQNMSFVRRLHGTVFSALSCPVEARGYDSLPMTTAIFGRHAFLTGTIPRKGRQGTGAVHIPLNIVYAVNDADKEQTTPQVTFVG